MSVFGDFRKVWVQRFPGSELPAAWEEDVRANLSKHKQKVAVLKEELEKEQFYVEYLERLLADVEKHKEINDVGSTNKAVKDAKRVNTCVDPQHGEKGEQQTQETPAAISASETQDKKRLSLCEDSANKCISELSVSMSEAVISSAGEEEVELRNSETSIPARQRSHTLSDASNYVTVIEVNGMNLRATKALSSFEPPRNNNQIAPIKKVPPKPPPKTFQHRPINKDDSSSSESTGKKSNDSSLERNLTEPEVVEEVPVPDEVKPPEPSANTLARREAEDTRQLVEAADMIAAAVQGEEDGEIVEPLPESREEEPLYDQVPMDAEGDYVYLATTGSNAPILEKASNESGGSLGSMSDLDGETTIKSQTSGYSACSSETGTTDTEPGVPAAPSPAPESPKRSNYVNIDYFIKQRGPAGTGRRSDSVESDDDVPPLMRTISSEPEDEEDGPRQDDIFRSLANAKYPSSSSLDATPSTAASAWRWPQAAQTLAADEVGSKAEAERIAMWRCIVSSILDSETVFLEGLGVLIQYMKAIRATLGSSQPIISQDDFNTIFYKVPELHAMHQTFLEGLKKSQDADGAMSNVGGHFRSMASQINEYGAFLHNYGRATDTVRKCKQNSPQFAQIMHSIPLRSKGSEQRLSLEDLLHKPVARVQKNALVLHDLLKYTPESYPDHKALLEALKMSQAFLDEFNMIQTKSMFPSHDRAQRRLVKNSFIVELSDGHRKLRHLFLFNDVIACAKYKASGRDKFTFELKWYISLCDIIVYEEFAAEPREASPANIVALKSAACTVRDQILWQERQLDDKQRPRHGAGRAEKQRKKLADLEAQLVLASPNLVFRVGQRNQRPYTFFLSSEFERTQWIDAIHALQVGMASQLPGPSVTVGMDELQAWITACRAYLKTDMGSYLLRSGRDESLLLGDLHVRVCRLRGLETSADLAVCLEVDSYGHYFRKARTKLVCGSSTPVWDEEFIIELEGSENLRVLLYEENGPRTMLRGRATQMLSRSWLGDQRVSRVLTLQGCELELSLRFVPSEVTLRRVPTAKTAGLFGAKIQHVCKRQKRPVPFIVTSCVREVERRGMNEVGIYRVSGSASDLARLKKSFETNSYEAEQLLKEVDVHSVTGVLKLYLRELPEALYTDELYPKLFDVFNNPTLDAITKRRNLLLQFQRLPPQNQHIIVFLLAHMVKIHQHEVTNKMSLHNLATVFGPTLLRPGGSQSNSRHRDPLAAGTVDVMAQAGILYHFLQSFVAGEIRTPTPPSPGPGSSALSSLSSSSSIAS